MLFGIYVLIGLAFDGWIGYTQPQSDTTLVLQTMDTDGKWIDTVLSTRIDTKDTTNPQDDELWVESGHWFRGWYQRLEHNPKVYVVRNHSNQRSKRSAYTAVPVNTNEAVERMTELMGKGAGYEYWIVRTLLLYAPIKPVRLDPGH